MARAHLRAVSDIERIATRVALGSVRPRELAGLRDTLASLPVIATILPADGGLIAARGADLALAPAR